MYIIRHAIKVAAADMWGFIPTADVTPTGGLAHGGWAGVNLSFNLDEAVNNASKVSSSV